VIEGHGTKERVYLALHPSHPHFHNHRKPVDQGLDSLSQTNGYASGLGARTLS
jgi:hypothetical protein